MHRWTGVIALGAVLGTAVAGCRPTGALGPPERQAQVFDQSDGGLGLDPASIAQFAEPLIIPPEMPPTSVIKQRGGKNIDYYEIAVRQFDQQILPTGYGPTTVWSYGSVTTAGTFNYPAFTIEARWRRPTRVKWVNDLRDASGHYLPHLLPVDQTLHWANPMAECISGADKTDCRGYDPTPYLGPVPIVTHVHGAETTEDSDGYPEAWYLPAASNLPAGIHLHGSLYGTFAASAAAQGRPWGPGYATYQYPNDMRATTLWYHDHSLGMTRLNVYAGPAGFYLLRGGPGDVVLDSATSLPAALPGPAPKLNDKFSARKRYAEIPIVIQDRSFKSDGALAYPDNRAFFEGVDPGMLSVPFIPADAVNGQPSDVSPLWNPEFFGNTMVVNGRTWPYLQVEPRRYRLRLLNGCQSRFLMLELASPATNAGVMDPTFWQIGADGGFLPAPSPLGRLLMAPAERADVIVDFTGLTPGDTVTLTNLGPDEPFGGGEPDVDFDRADPATTGVVMQFRVVPLAAPDPSTPPDRLLLPARVPLGAPTAPTRRISLNEEESKTVYVVENPDGSITEVAADAAGAAPFGPTAALLGTVNAELEGEPMMWSQPITETPGVGAVEEWEIYNFTMDAHPIHIHLVQFEVVARAVMGDAAATSLAGSNAPLSWERGTKDTVIAYPGEITRVKAFFSLPGLYVWHCHILEHEDNEMMRPYCVAGASPSPGCLRAAELAMP